MTKPLITLPCTAQELENALHAACDHDGLWNAKIVVIPPRFGDPRVCHPYYYTLAIETEKKEPQQACMHCANKDCEARGTYQIVVCNHFTTKGETHEA